MTVQSISVDGVDNIILIVKFGFTTKYLRRNEKCLIFININRQHNCAVSQTLPHFIGALSKAGRLLVKARQLDER